MGCSPCYEDGPAEPWIGMFTGVNGPGWPMKGLAAAVYLGEDCADSPRCAVVDQQSLHSRCDAAATVCVHMRLGPEPRIPSRSALCDAHSLQARSVSPDYLIERMHSI